jgi:transposase
LKVQVVRSPVTDGHEALPAGVQGRSGGVVSLPARATIAQIAADLGVNRETLRSWIRIDDGTTVGRLDRPSRPAAPAPGADAEVAALRKRIRELEEERDILRKAARYFAGETRW